MMNSLSWRLNKGKTKTREKNKTKNRKNEDVNAMWNREGKNEQGI